MSSPVRGRLLRETGARRSRIPDSTPERLAIGPSCWLVPGGRWRSGHGRPRHHLFLRRMTGMETGPRSASPTRGRGIVTIPAENLVSLLARTAHGDHTTFAALCDPRAAAV